MHLKFFHALLWMVCSRDQGIAEKLNIIKDRFDADKVVQGANRGDVFFGNAKVNTIGQLAHVQNARTRCSF